MSELRYLVGERIRAIRKAKGLTQLQLAELSSLDDAYIGAVERGERNFTIDTLEKIHTALQVDTADLFRNDAVKNKDELVRRQATDEFIALISDLKSEQIEIVKRINKELVQAFSHPL
ncbi:helix-turn-helix domain-containing protein [Paenibacillus sp. MZ04-78.2]|uniref:helix-turn-helix domain-containing protein n=1 Tax=Paenibacillus sp. MZ04-78.2 TaxID=2962034 RepID=UPI0020B7A873|nr:helix-turn-helix transcriptional regulator [Paenibacillus sp. MZ04-78.2]MCP3775228.1 helix-turn-helix domain-containing protein [Paenibacillus sp. MZ04-78.2]